MYPSYFDETTLPCVIAAFLLGIVTRQLGSTSTSLLVALIYPKFHVIYGATVKTSHDILPFRVEYITHLESTTDLQMYEGYVSDQSSAYVLFVHTIV